MDFWHIKSSRPFASEVLKLFISLCTCKQKLRFLPVLNSIESLTPYKLIPFWKWNTGSEIFMEFLEILLYAFPLAFVTLSQTADNGCCIWTMCTLASTGFFLEKWKNWNGILRRVVKIIPLSFQVLLIGISKLSGLGSKMCLLMLRVL